MAAGEPIQPDASILIFPAEATPGALGAFARYDRLNEIRELEEQRQGRIWVVRGVVSDHVPLAGDAPSVQARRSYHHCHLNENPLRIYLHWGGRNAVYYELVGDAQGKLTHISVRVESRLPRNGLLLARMPLNALLDVITRNFDLPLVLQRLELLSPRDGAVLVTEMLIPNMHGIAMGPLGGIIQSTQFAPYDALYREALTTSSPFYRLLCAWKMYEGTNQIRRWIREQCQQRGVQARIPPDPEVDRDELIRIGLDPAFVGNMVRARDLFDRLADARHAVAHFLIETDEGEAHAYLADGGQLRMYAAGSAALLRYAHRILEELRLFCGQHLPILQRGAILPMVENRDQFIVRARDYGLE